MRAFSFCAQQSNQANITSLNCSTNRYTIKNTLEAVVSRATIETNFCFDLFVFVLSRIFFCVNQEALVVEQRLNLFTHARETWRKRAVIGHFHFKFVSFYGRTELTWGLQTMSHDWSQLFNFVSFYGHVNRGHVTYK